MTASSSTSTAGASAGDVASSAPGGAALSVAITDANILAVLHEANQGEIDAAHLALSSTSNPRVQAFAHQMIRDHTKLDRAGDSVATAVGITPTLPADDSLGTHGREEMRALQAAGQGTQFDKQYMEAQVEDHTMVLGMLQQFRGEAENAQVKAAVSGAIPIVRGHLERAKRVAAAVGAAAT
ncbi:MAG TPA: DUF4142 domain-containing protein [Gemmatimonadaceae bacterium]|nr:DUF4142 domain-containing protein [Gemmatimonadaceae bacterium]